MNYRRFNKRQNIGVAAQTGVLAITFLIFQLGVADGFAILLVSGLLLVALGVLTSFAARSDYQDLNHWYEQILDFVYLPMSITDMDMKWTFINAPVKDIIGVTREEVIGDHCSKWNADICNTEKCGVAMLRKGFSQSFFSNEGVNRNFQVDTTYLYDRKNPEKPIGHLELVSDVTTKVRLDSAVDHLRSSSSNLASTIEEEAATTIELSAAAEQFSKNLQSLMKNGDRQYGIIEETVSALEEMASSINSVSQIVRGMTKNSKESVNFAMEGQEVIKETIEGVKRVSGNLQAISTEIINLAEKAEQVDEILQVINGIASQTNLLSMNAAIEAAHAGDTGKGFSVVAEEIRKLAENAQNSSKDIEKILKEIRSGVEGTKNLSDQGLYTVSENVTNIERSMSSLGQIVDTIKSMDTMLNEINQSTDEQASATTTLLDNARDLKSISDEVRGSTAEQTEGIQQITDSLLVLSQSSNENVDSAEKLKLAAQELELKEE